MLLDSRVTTWAALLSLAVALYRRLSSPISRQPGPLVSKFTSLVLRWHELRANRTLYVHSLHEKYGAVVRVSPNELSFASWAAVKEIYCSNGSGYDKTDFYDLFTIYGRRTMFTKLDKTEHAKRKRIIADRYANRNVMKDVSMIGIQQRSARFVERCENAAGQTPDIFMALHAYACDCVTHHLFHPHGTNCLEDKGDEEMMHQVAGDDSLQNRLISWYAPTLHALLSRVIHLVAPPRKTPLADNYVLETSMEKEADSFTLLSRLNEKTGELDEIDAAAECLDHMVAGIDTTGDGLCFLLWELSQPQSLHIQRKLSEEVRKNPGAAIDQLAYLDAVVNEGLRVYPPIPMSLPRVVPAGGKSIDGVWVPENTIVSCQAHSVHRINSDVFPAPERFDPDRWMAPEGDMERRRLLFAFSNGGRGCVGKHLALAEMKTLLRDVYSRFSTTPDASMTAESMAMSDQLISSRPLGQRCLLKFQPLDAQLSITVPPGISHSHGEVAASE